MIDQGLNLIPDPPGMNTITVKQARILKQFAQQEHLDYQKVRAIFAAQAPEERKTQIDAMKLTIKKGRRLDNGSAPTPGEDLHSKQ